MTSDDKSGPGTPFGEHPATGCTGPQYVTGQDGAVPLSPLTPVRPYGQPGPGPSSGYASPGQPLGYDAPGHDHPTQVFHDRPAPTAPLPGYAAADFPAPAGVAALAPAPAGGTALAGRPRRRLGALVVAASLAAVVGAGAGVGSFAYLTDGGAVGTASPISVTTVPASQTPVLDGTITAAADKIQPSVVTITVQAGQSGDIGSGVVLDDQGHILTNEHVVSAAAGTSGQTAPGQSGSGAGTITVTFHNGSTAKATVVGTSPTNDLAVIKVDGVDDLTPAVFAKSSSLQTGQAVVAAGAPLGLSESVTSGIVSNTARPVRSGDDDDAVYLAVQTDAAINPGNSGGPLVDLNGSVVGINSSIASTGSSSGSSSQSGNIGIGFAIPADVATRVAGELIQDGTSVNAALGVTVGGTDSAVSTATGVPLQSVTADGAAAQAGLQQGDVVTRLDDFATTTPDGLIAATRFYAPGTEVTVTYTRGNGDPQTAKVTLGEQ
ncbi:putative serine protease PepD [Friedmanniella luteola]|uniref:Putative serine protease PepD n=1 Tax=Friedmanniella luteola TaxID=546871 RepID=A0A1H1LEL7_9ACTN|nr:trypsin-like peptidase domain-containing protein [Friedmanniella luteola]SDR73024.1 putative serine protease PepD [Friedmanniella luteola]